MLYTDISPDYEPYQPAECIGCEELKNNLDGVRYWLVAVLDELYSEKTLNVKELELALEELCCVSGLKMPKSEINIQRPEVKSGKIENTLEKWKKFNYEYLSQLTV